MIFNIHKDAGKASIHCEPGDDKPFVRKFMRSQKRILHETDRVSRRIQFYILFFVRVYGCLPPEISNNWPGSKY